MTGRIRLLLRGIREVGVRPAWDGIVHAVRTPWIEAKFADPERPLRGIALILACIRRLSARSRDEASAGPIVTSPGSLLSVARRGQTLTLTFTDAAFTLTILAPDLCHVTHARSHGRSASTTIGPGAAEAILSRPHSEWPACPFEVVETPSGVEVRTERLIWAVSRTDGRIALRDLQGNDVIEGAAAGWTADGRVACRWKIPPDAHFYGLGMRTTGLDRRGGSYVNWNTDPRTYEGGDDPVNLCVPFFMALHSEGRQAYGLLLENTTRSRVDLGQADVETLSIEVEDDALGYYLIYGPSPAAVLERYADLTGRVPLFPLWALGYHQSRWSYFPDQSVRRVARDFRQTHAVPCDAIHLDIHYMHGNRCFTWDPSGFPDPTGLIADLHGQGFRIVTIIDPGIKADRGYRVFRDGLDRDVFCRYPDGRLCIGPVWPGNCAFPDFTHPGGRAWWGDLHAELLDAGVDGIWADMNEPALFGEHGATLPAPARHDLEGHAGDHRRAHNVYGLQMARATAEGLARLRPERRPFVLTRSGWAGVQRYAAHWTGDNRSTWESLRLTLPMVLGLGLSGIGFTGADVGGFKGFPSAELFTRWLQLGVFLPFFRSHTALDSPDQEPWSWGEPFLSINRDTIRFRYQLLPYLYTALWKCTQNGMPIARPLLLAFHDDPTARALEDEFLCGDALLVAPVLEEGAVRRSVYLPAGGWYDLWDDSLHEGPAHVEVQAPLERIPVFVRAGSVVPAISAEGEDVPSHTGRGLQAGSARTLALHLYPPAGRGDEPCRSLLYEDDGESLAHLQGEVRLTHFETVRTDTGLEVTRISEGAFEGACSRFVVVVHDVAPPPKTVEGWSGGEVAFAREQRTLRMSGGTFDRLRMRW
jgi:alpha-glucosidase